jgi:hypothetical protein
MAFMYPRNARDSWGHVKGLYTYYSILNRLFRKTLTPRDGNTSDITAFQRNLMAAMKPGEPAFHVGDFLWQEIRNSSENPQRLCSYGPYISYIIKKVTQRAYPNDTKHRPLQPKPSMTVRVPSPQDDQQEEQDILEEMEAPHSWEAYQPGGGSTAPQGRSNYPWQEEKKHTSPLLNFELSWRNRGVAGGGNDSDDDSDEEEDEEEEQQGGQQQQLGRPYIREPNYPSYRWPIDYYQAGMADTVVNLRRTNPASEERTSIDYRFRTIFQRDYYTTAIITSRKSKITNDAQYLDWEFMERKNNPIFDKVIQACEAKGIKALMGFKQHWNKELIAQFYVTMYFDYVPKEDGRSDRAMFWMTEGESHHLSFSNFLTLFRLLDDGFARFLHDEGPLEAKRMAFMYPRNARDSWGHVKGLYT